MIVERLHRQSKGYLANLPASPAVEAFVTGSDTLPPPTGYITRPYAQNGTIYRAINVWARTVSRIPIRVFPDDSESSKEIEGHWIPRLLRSPGYNRRGTRLMQATVISLKLRGEAFHWHLDMRRGARSAPRRPHALALLSPLSMRPGRKSNGEIKTWVYSSPYGDKHLSVEELTVFQYENPYDEDRGLGPIQAGILEWTGDHRAATWLRSFYDNDARPPLLFVPKQGTWADSERRRFLAAWNRTSRGVANAGRANTLPKPMDIEELKFTQAEMEFFEGRRFLGQKILQPLGVPPFLASDLEHANWSNSVTQLRSFYQNDVDPESSDLSGVLTVDLAHRYESTDYQVLLDMSPLMAEVTSEEIKTKVETAKALWGMAVPLWEINRRLMLGLELSPSDEQHKTGFLPVSVMPAELMLEEPEDEPTDPGDGGDPPDDPGDDPEEERQAFLDVIKEAATEYQRRGRKDSASDERQRQILASGLARQYAPISRPYHRRLRQWLHGLRTETVDNINRLGSKDLDDPMPDASPEDLVFEAEGAYTALSAATVPFWTRALIAGGKSMGRDLGISIAFDIEDAEVQEFLAGKAVQLRGVSNTVRERVKATISRAISEGASIREAASMVRQAFQSERARSITTARTEMAQAFGGGRFQAAKRAGVQEIQWISSRDQRVRETHAGLDGKTVKLGEVFSNGLKYPGDSSASAANVGEVINCRCQIRHVGRRPRR